jgi:hypothetical protein
MTEPRTPVHRGARRRRSAMSPSVPRSRRPRFAAPVARLALAAAALLAVACSGIFDEQEQQAFRARLGSVSFTVYPAFVRGVKDNTWDDASAVRLATAIADSGCGLATASDVHVPITGEVHMNQARMWKESAAEFGAWIAAHTPATDYAILPEYIGVPATKEAGGIHAYVVDREGKLVDGVLLNNHQEVFSSAHPRTAEDCSAVLMTVMREEWAQRSSR